MQMRMNNDNRLYKNPSDIISSYGCVWENGKYGYFIPFEHIPLGYDFIKPKFGGGQKDGKGLRFVQEHKDGSKSLVYLKNNGIIISGFGEYVLENWGKDLQELCEKYIYRKLLIRIEQWNKENYPNTIDQQTGLQLLKKLREAEQNQWKKATISDFFSIADNDNLVRCMNSFFDSIDKIITQAEQPKYRQLPESEKQPKSYINKEITAKITKVYDFCIETKVLDENTISNIDFLNAVNTADFKAIHNHAEQEKSKSKCKYIIFVLSKFINPEWYLKAAHSINTEPNKCSGMNVPPEWKNIADTIK